ncbi:hypothetical protein [Streptosporangium sp. NPDC051022]|uniref:hypothetical protein n=1 Tax=Streptosporangium sp. NPDC051022 TaxID=3155752 RepID=UPI00342A718F
MNIRDDIAARYAHAVEVSREDLPTTTHAMHTMGSAVDSYAAQRVPGRLLDNLARIGGSIEIHAIMPGHMPVVMPDGKLLNRGHRFGTDKHYNVVRPQVFRRPDDGGRRIVMAVPPGTDYLLHYASLVAHYLRSQGHPSCVLRRVVRYPDAEDSIADWTGLGKLIEPGDRVLMGYVRELVQRMVDDGATVLDKAGNDFYGTVTVALPGGQRVRALGVRYSFWGCISGRLAVACQRAGAAEVVYAGKLGTLTAPEDIYHKVFLPSSYLNYGHPEPWLSTAQAPVNGLLVRYPELDSGVHMSVGTVLEEDIEQRRYAEAFNTTSIDNEIAQMARALTADPGSHRAAFSALHFATDYLLRQGEREHRTVFNLTNHRTRRALQGKRVMLNRVAALLQRYYTYEPVFDTTSAATPSPVMSDDRAVSTIIH